jgi:hypothetical protein
MSNRYYTLRLRMIAEHKEKTRRKRRRPKSFKSEEAAKNWATANKITNYSLKNLKSPESRIKKIVVIK